ncbi:efflux RND transporter permease subunit, partial [Enterobacter hormaechei]|uniref:efflux RND transporter permease subunit n=1 Tax=Enterobacter hormaechei TaxID=158836 RepID=UPI0013D7D95A
SGHKAYLQASLHADEVPPMLVAQALSERLQLLDAAGAIDGERTAFTIGANDQITRVEDYKALILRTANGDVIRLGAIADVRNSTRNSRAAGWY